MSSPSIHFNTVGKEYNGFTVTKILDITELQCTLLELTHQQTGAQVIHLANDDPENTFCLSFRTLPDSSNGAAHILEHTVLCGSKKYPVKDPFFLMGRRSLNTFMNALTGSDFTCYPAASQVKKDFYNLLEVYIDAVFHPLIKELSFLQEGCRIEFANPTDSESPLEYKGIVFNEMKGAFTSPTERLSEAFSAALFPDITYGQNSGGNPKEIPNLTYQQLKNFHETYYHPSRCLFFFYGNLSLEGHLDFIAEHALKMVPKLPEIPSIPKQQRFSKPVHKKLGYPIAQDEESKDKTMVAMGWLTCHVLEQKEVLALSIIELILMGTDAAPLKMALLRSGLCKQAASDIDEDISEVPFMILLKGCNPDKAEEIETLIRQTLAEVAANGIPLPSIESALHQLEFHRSEITGNQAPFGLSLFMRSALLKQHEGKPEDGLMIHSLIDALRRDILADSRYLEKLIIKYLLENPHFVRLEMVPDKELAASELMEERANLDAHKAKLTDEQKKAIVKQAAELKAFQEKQQEDDEDVLPKVTLDDVPKHVRNFPLQQEKVGNLEVYHYNGFTNHIVYADLTFPLPDVKEEDLSMVRLFTVLLNQMGCGGRDYKENLEYIQSNTGGIGAGLNLNLHVSDFNLFAPKIYIKGKALHHKANKLFPLMLDMAESVDFTDAARLEEVLKKHYTGLRDSVNQSALKYAINLSASHLNKASKIAQSWYGLDYYWKIKELTENFDKHSRSIIDQLEKMKKTLLCTEGADLVITCDSASYNEFKDQNFFGLSNIQSNPFTPWKGDYKLSNVQPQGRIIASPIAFSAKAFPTVPFIHPASPALNIIAFLFDNMTLHARIREQGGAYGAGSTSNAISGNFYFYSYRDPHIVNTLNAFDESVAAILNGDFQESDLEEAKLEMIQSMDSPIAPGSKGEVAYNWMKLGKTLEVRQNYRDKILALTREDIIAAVKDQIIPNIDKGVPVIFAGKDLLEKENAVLEAEGKSPLKIESI